MRGLRLQSDLTAWLSEGNRCFATSLNCFVKCFNFARCERVISCQKWVTWLTRWYSVGVAKVFITRPVSVGMAWNVQARKGRTSNWTLYHGTNYPVVDLRKFSRVIGRVFQGEQESL